MGQGRQTERCERVKNTWYGPLLGGSGPLTPWCFVLTEPRIQMLGQSCFGCRVYFLAESKDLGLKRCQDMHGNTLQTHQFPLVQFLHGWTWPGKRQMLGKIPIKSGKTLLYLRYCPKKCVKVKIFGSIFRDIYNSTILLRKLA